MTFVWRMFTGGLVLATFAMLLALAGERVFESTHQAPCAEFRYPLDCWKINAEKG